MAVVNLEIARTTPFAGGESFGDVGEYRLVEGTAHYAVDPLHASNSAITDIELAPRDSKGKVWFSSDFKMLQPANPDRGKHRMLFDVVNRGNVTALSGFNDAGPFDPSLPLNAGNGWLMREGYTVVMSGWQADLPATPGLVGMQAPEAIGSDGGPLVGKMLCQFQCNEPVNVFLLADRRHTPHPPANIDDPTATLTVRDHPNEPARPVSRDKWSFVRVEDEQVEPDPSHIYMASGFEPGKVYQLVYSTRGSTIVGLGMAAMRDIVSFLKYGSAEQGNPCAGDIERAHAVGRSQSGRFLRQYIHAGLNTDEEGRMALDGIIAHVAGGMRGEFNLRFGQPSKDVCFIIPGLFPFTDTVQTDPVTGDSGSMLDRMNEQGQIPKIMFTNTSAEYWRGDAALIHTNLENMTDAQEDSEHVRRYHFAGTQHGSGAFPPLEIRPVDGVKGQLPFNSVDYNPLMRAALNNLDSWVSGEKPAPPSRHPSLNDGTAVETYTLADKFAKLPNAQVNSKPTRAMRLDYGSETHLGRTIKLPAEQGEQYPALVSDVNEDFNEIAGIRLPDISVPVATYTGWNLRHRDIGNPELVIGITGGLAGWTLPMPATREARERSGDPRLSIEERYESRDDYLERVREAARKLADEGYMVEEDIERVTERCAVKYDYYAPNGKNG
jgi:hypothetical protein